MAEDTQLAVPALAAPVDGLREVIRTAVRTAIETAVTEELTAALGTAAWERTASRVGYRHGTTSRTLVTGEGPAAIRVPRGRVRQPDGRIGEWRSRVLPRYARRHARVDAVLARLYLSGASTRDLRRALAPLFGTRALSRSAVSRVVAKLRTQYDAWRHRALGGAPIVHLFLDGQRVPVRAGGRVTAISVLMALGVYASGDKVVLGLRVVGGERTEAWAGLLEDLVTRGLARPQLVISDGSKGAEAALQAAWPGIALQRCLVHKLRNLLAVTPRPLQGTLVRDFRHITAATSPETVTAAVAAFRRTWSTRWSADVVCLDEAGPGLTAFTTCPVAQWQSLRSTNIIERFFAEFRRRLKVQGALPSAEAILTIVWGTLASGGIQLRRLKGFRSLPVAQAA